MACKVSVISVPVRNGEAFGMYLLTGFAIGSAGVFALAILALFLFGVVGLINLFSRDCRKAFGVN